MFSVGGGALAEEGHDKSSGSPEIYDMNTMSQILYWCEHTGRNYWEYVEQCEGEDIWDYLMEVWETMKAAIHRGLDAEGALPGPLNLRRKASSYYIKAKGFKDSVRSRGLVFAYALAVSEENASGGKSSLRLLVALVELCLPCFIICRRAESLPIVEFCVRWLLPDWLETSLSITLLSLERKPAVRQKLE